MSEKACEVCGMPVHPDLERHAGACEVSVAARRIDALRSLCAQLAEALGPMGRAFRANETGFNPLECISLHDLRRADAALAAFRSAGFEAKR